MFTNQQAMNILCETYRLVRWQTERIAQLEVELSEIKSQLQSLQSSPRTNIEKIEYNFEQLKVETLEGTLTIGISGAGLTGNIEDLMAGQQHSQDVSIGQQGDDAGGGMLSRLRGEVNQYIHNSISSSIDKRSEAMQVPITPEQKSMILEDMVRQAGERITLYIKQLKETLADGDPSLPGQVFERLRGDIDLAVDAYIEHFRKDEEDDQTGTGNTSDQ
ncbi:spore germination protein GerPC [Paenibacillus thermotolerans]|uniref:spore germination protein GerPC n=1 Tax=Paenibacillus thermotolerans TaxID=3027807 RepID=UPI0023674228|nr:MULTISPECIES: spore germination protein GerPC [unclassified Paenibacillus]